MGRLWQTVDPISLQSHGGWAAQLKTQEVGTLPHRVKATRALGRVVWKQHFHHCLSMSNVVLIRKQTETRRTRPWACIFLKPLLMYVSLLTSTGSWSKGRELSLNFLSFCPVSLVLAKLLLMCNPPLCMKDCLCKVTPCKDGFRWLFTNRGSSTPRQRLSKPMDAALEATSAWSLWSYFFVLTGPWDTNRNPLIAASHVSEFSQVHRGPVALSASPPDFELRAAELFRCSCSGFQSGYSARADHTWCLQGTRPRNPSAGDNHRRGSGLVGTGWVGSRCFMTALLEFRIVQLRTLTLHTHPDLCSMPRSTPSSWLCHVLYLWQSPAFPGNLENGKLNVRHTI